MFHVVFIELRTIMSALPAITAHAALHGTIPTALMAQLSGDISVEPASQVAVDDQQQPPRKKAKVTKMLLEDKAIHFQRAVWLSHDAVTAERRAKAEVKIKEDEAKREAAAKKESVRLQKIADKTARDQKREAERETALAKKQAGAPPRKKIKTHCANSTCYILWEESSVGWRGCNQRRKECQLWFCHKKKCQAQLAAHEKVCAAI